MITAQLVPLSIDRGAPRVFTIEITGIDLTGADFHAQIRLTRDAPGDPLLDLPKTTSGTATGVRLVAVDTSGTLPISWVRLQIPAMASGSAAGQLPLAAELGDDVTLYWDMFVTPAGRTTDQWFYGPVTVSATVTKSSMLSAIVDDPLPGADAVATLTGPDLTVTLAGAALIQPLVDRADGSAAAAIDAAAHAETKAQVAVDAANAAQTQVGALAGANAATFVDESNLKGGYRTVADLAARNAIPADRRSAGMEVRVVGDDGTGVFGRRFLLGSDLTTWTGLPVDAELTRQAAFAGNNATLSSNLDGIPWLSADAVALTGAAANLAWTTTTRMIARAIKSITVEGPGVNATDDWFIAAFSNADPTYGDLISVRKVSDPTVNLSLGTTPIAKNTTGPTEVIIASGAPNINFRLLIDYRDITVTGLLVNTTTLTVPLIMGRSLGPIERDRQNLAAQLRSSLWLDPDAPGLVGVAAGLKWDANARKVARAIKDVRLGFGFDPAQNYVITRLARAHSAENYRIDIKTMGGATAIAVSAITAEAANGVTRVDLYNGTSFFATMWIDYRELVSGTTYILDTAPLVIARSSYSRNIAARRDKLTRVRNIAFDSIGARAAASSSWNASSTNVFYKTAGPNAALSALGVAGALDIGTGANLTYFWNGQNTPARPNGKYVYRSLYVYSADGATWPTDGSQSLLAYSQADSGGSSVAGVFTVDRGWKQISTNVRLYYYRARLPDTGTIGRILHGFTSFPSGAVVEVGGFTFAISDSELDADNTAVDDWTGYSTRDTWRDATDTNISNIQFGAVFNYPYGNSLTNGAGDPAYGNYTNVSASLLTAPTSTVQQDHSIKRAIRVGTAAISFQYLADPVLDATAASQYWYASAYVYSPDGTSWIVPQIGFYAGSTVVGAIVNLTNFLQIDANNRLYWGTGQLANRTDLTVVRMGTATSNLSVENQLGGFQFVRYARPVSFANTNKDDWNYKRATAATSKLSGAVIPWIGDSIVGDFNLPALLATELAAIVPNFGFPGLRMSNSADNTGNNQYFNQLSGVALAQSIASGDWSTPTAAAAALWSGGYTAHDYRAHVAAMAAFNWSTATILPISYGTNDWAGGVTIDATTSTDVKTINGAINTIVSLIQAKYPTLPIILGAPMWRMATLGGDSNTAANSSGVTLAQVQAAIKERCEYYQLPCWEPAKRVGFNQYNYGQASDNGNGLYSSDGLHPTTAAAQARFISRFSAWLRSLF